MSTRSDAIRRPRRNGWRSLRLVLMLAFAVEVGVSLAYSPALRIKEVSVEGIALTAPEQVVQAVRIADGSSWVMLAPSRIAHRLQLLPTVAEAVVSRGLPGKVHIRVFERQPVALLSTPSGSYWVDARGVAFWRTKQAEELPVIQVIAPLRVLLGQVVANRSVQSALEILTRYLPEYPLPIAQITVDREGNLCLNMRDGLPPVRIGDGTALSAKMMRTAEMWTQSQIIQQAEYLDVSCVDRPVWKPRDRSKGGSL
ncbi:MAG: hypothetical protein C4335_10765 [Armatimonadota bacterium]